VFRCCEETSDQPGLDPDYLDHLRESDYWSSFVGSSGNGSVRIRIYYDDLAVMPIQLPRIAEQRKIAALLNALDCEISLLSKELDALKTQKKGITGKLLSGEVRVKGAAA
jgi:type I restriction enzyme S subunit